MSEVMGVAFVTEYACRHCGTLLRASDSGVSRWLRCPECGRATLPPEFAERRGPRFVPLPTDPPEDLLVIGPLPEPKGMTPVGIDRQADPLAGTPDGGAGTEPTASVRRVVAATALFLSVTLLLFSYLDHSTRGTTLFSVASLVALVFLFWPVRP